MIQIVTLCLFLAVFPVKAALKVAVASNFKVTLMEIVKHYEAQSGQQIIISSASTATLYNQIRYGAPFDLFLSADSYHAKLLENSELGVTGSRFIYARGVLAFWSPKGHRTVDEQYLFTYKDRLAIANPKLAPYGVAAKQALLTLGLWSELKYIKGNNIAQTYQFIDTGNVDAGFVAYSHLLQNNAKNYYLLPTTLYQPLLQEGVMLTNASNMEALQAFVDFLQSDLTQKLIRNKGYL